MSVLRYHTNYRVEKVSLEIYQNVDVEFLWIYTFLNPKKSEIFQAKKTDAQTFFLKDF